MNMFLLASLKKLECGWDVRRVISVPQMMAQVWVAVHRRRPLLHIRIRLDPQHPTCDHHLSSDGSISRESPDSKALYAGTTTTTIGRSLFKKIQLV